MSQGDVRQFLMKHGPATAKEIAVALDLSLAAVSSNLRKLVRARFVKKIRKLDFKCNRIKTYYRVIKGI